MTLYLKAKTSQALQSQKQGHGQSQKIQNQEQLSF
jgi:hypothetical protein